MFTGIIEAVGQVERADARRLVIRRPESFTDVREGSSIAVSGVCLTVLEWTPAAMEFELSEETLSRTTLGSLSAGSIVNLERALPARGRFDGHIVQGHVDAVGNILAREGETITVGFPAHFASSIVEKGSIAIDGVSLTVANIHQDSCKIALLPYTVENTTFIGLQKGSNVNIETDIIGRYLHKFMKSALIEAKNNE